MNRHWMRILFATVFTLSAFTWTVAADEVDQSCTTWSGVTQIQSGMPIGQEFVPSFSATVGVDLRLCDFNVGFPPAPVTVLLREGTITGPVVPGSEVTLVPDVPTGFEGAWEVFRFDAPLTLSTGETYVIEASTTTPKWGWTGYNSECYEAGGNYYNGEWGYSDRGFRTWVASTYGLSATLECDPASGVLPFVTSITATLGHGDYNNVRRIAARLNVSIASGAYFGSWRAGYTNTDAVEPHVAQWLQNIPALGTLVGDNVFALLAEDVTPAPYNQPPYLPSGATATDTCTVTADTP
jgi:hypothetical protein